MRSQDIKEVGRTSYNSGRNVTTAWTLWNIKVGLSLYRDHPPQDSSFVTAVFQLDEIRNIQDKLEKIVVGGGGDIPEAVFDGIINGTDGMQWRDGSNRIAFLIGDAPPHGMAYEEPCCLCGLTWGDAVAALEGHGVTLYSISLHPGPKQVFKMLANYTGGFLVESPGVMEAICNTLTSIFEGRLDSSVLEAVSKGKSTEEIDSMISVSREKSAASFHS